MPIDYEYGNPVFAGFAAGQVGQALDKRAQEQLEFDRALKLAQLGEQARQFDVAKTIEQNMAALQDQRARQLQGLQFARDRAQVAQQQTDDWRDFQQQLALNQANRLGMMEQLGYQNQLQSLASAAEDQRNWMLDAGEQANENAKQALSNVQAMNLSPEGQQLRSQWRAKINAYQAQQGEMRPQTYAQGMAELLSGMAKSGIDDFEVKDMTPEEIMAKQVIWQDENNMLIQQPDGKLTLQGKTQPKPAKEDAPDPSKAMVDTPYGRQMTAKDFETRYRTDYADAERRVIAKKKAEEMAKPNPNPNADFYASPEEINAEIRKFNEGFAAFREGRKAKTVAQVLKERAKQAAGFAQNVLNTPQQLAEAALAALPSMPQMPAAPPVAEQPPVVEQPPVAPPVEQPVVPPVELPPVVDMPYSGPPPTVEFPVAENPGNVEPTPLADDSAMPPRYAMPSMKPEDAAANPEVKGWFKFLDTVYFKALTPEEVKDLPPGTKVVLPDGRIATKK